MLDLHNHTLPGVDDGAADWAESLAMARIAVEDGVTGVVCTPHWCRGRFENTRLSILDGVEDLRRELRSHEIPLAVYPGSELLLDFDLIARLDSGELLTLNDTGRYVLIELPVGVLPPNLEDFFWEFLTRDLIPVLGHPERHPQLIRDPMPLYTWITMGVLTQITSTSLTGLFGTRIRRFSHFLLEHGMAHILASDAHSMHGRNPRLSGAVHQVESILGPNAARRMTLDTPKAVIEGTTVQVDDPIRPGSSSPKGLLRRIFSFFGRSSRQSQNTIRLDL